MPHADSSTESSTRAGVIAGLVDSLLALGALIGARSCVVLADFLATFLELVAVLLSYLAVRKMSRKTHHEFEYGIGKLESLSSLFVGVLMVVCLFIMVGSAAHNLIHPIHISGIGVWISMGIQIVYSGVNGLLCRRSHLAAKAESSPLMAAQARLFLARIIGNVFILLSLALSLLLRCYKWSFYIDPAASIAIAGSTLLAALGIFSGSFNDLLDRTLDESCQFIILRELARHFHDYEALHGIRSRRAGSHVFIEIFLEFDPEKKLAEVQPIADRLRRNIEEKIRNSRVTIGLTSERIR
ncbi:MAG: cation diffusion facilitator family transporter [Planctomycetota bacterium]